MALHKDLTGADLHEPKGASTATLNSAYISDGAGSGSWEKVTIDSLDGTSVWANTFSMFVKVNDISTAENIFIPIPFNCTIININGVLGGNITLANTTINYMKNGSASLGIMTVPFAASTEGNTLLLSPTINNTFTVGQYLKIVVGGESTTAAGYGITLNFIRTP